MLILLTPPFIGVGLGESVYRLRFGTVEGLWLGLFGVQGFNVPNKP